jgi:hypothetical protein
MCDTVQGRIHVCFLFLATSTGGVRTVSMPSGFIPLSKRSQDALIVGKR